VVSTAHPAPIPELAKVTVYDPVPMCTAVTVPSAGFNEYWDSTMPVTLM